METQIEVKSANPSNLEDVIPHSDIPVKRLGVKLAVLSVRDQADRLEFMEHRGRFEGLPHQLRVMLNHSWFNFISEKYSIDRERHPKVVYNQNDGIVCEVLDA